MNAIAKCIKISCNTNTTRNQHFLKGIKVSN